MVAIEHQAVIAYLSRNYRQLAMADEDLALISLNALLVKAMHWFVVMVAVVQQGT